MAIVTINAARTFKDLDLNFNIHPVRKDVTKHVNEYAIINSIKNLVLTVNYERPFRPEIGSGIRALLFENITPIIAAQIERAIEETVTNFEPRVQVKKVTCQGTIFSAQTPENNGYSVNMEFFIINNPNPVKIDFFLERIR